MQLKSFLYFVITFFPFIVYQLKMSVKKLSLKLYDGYPLPQDFYTYPLFREAVDYEPQVNDLFVVSFPKSGTTWTQYIVWEILTDGGEPPFVNEMWFTLGPEIAMIGSKRMLEIPNHLSHRLIKTHFPFEYQPYNSKGKYIYIARNPFEVCVSYFKDVSRSPYIFGDHNFDEWVQLFVSGYTPFGDYFDHIYSWFTNRNRDNVLFITYEELNNNQKEYILKIAEFIGRECRQKLDQSSQLLNKIIDYTDFDYMKTLPFILPNSLEVANITGLDAKKNLELTNNNNGYRLHPFFNVGKVGYSYDMFTEKQIKQIKSRVYEKFDRIPELLHIWRRFGIKI